ncbi:MAG: DUF494 domain-containing protein [Sulfuricella sp.]|nr:DUF494 domain-containing protein [Sulfuricella sp.]
MFDILVYLFENYLEAHAYPDESTLTRELSAAGFDHSEINLALSWFQGLEELVGNQTTGNLGSSVGTRLYTDNEYECLGVEGIGLLAFLEGSGILDAIRREQIIDRSFAVNERGLSVEQIKWIVLFVLWGQSEPQQFVFVEDLLFGDHQPALH